MTPERNANSAPKRNWETGNTSAAEMILNSHWNFPLNSFASWWAQHYLKRAEDEHKLTRKRFSAQQMSERAA